MNGFHLPEDLHVFVLELAAAHVQDLHVREFEEFVQILARDVRILDVHAVKIRHFRDVFERCGGNAVISLNVQ